MTEYELDKLCERNPECKQMYNVLRYYGRYPYAIMDENLDYETATKVADKLNRENREEYVEYKIKKQ